MERLSISPSRKGPAGKLMPPLAFFSADSTSGVSNCAPPGTRMSVSAPP